VDRSANRCRPTGLALSSDPGAVDAPLDFA